MLPAQKELASAARELLFAAGRRAYSPKVLLPDSIVKIFFHRQLKLYRTFETRAF